MIRITHHFRYAIIYNRNGGHEADSYDEWIIHCAFEEEYLISNILVEIGLHYA